MRKIHSMKLKLLMGGQWLNIFFQINIPLEDCSSCIETLNETLETDSFYEVHDASEIAKKLSQDSAELENLAGIFCF